MRFRRLVLPLLLATAIAPAALAQSAPAPVAANAEGALVLKALDGREIPITLVAPANPRGVILFSHGGGSSPKAMATMFGHLSALGYAVVAPMHTDSRDMAEDRRTDLQGAFPTRIADMQVAAGFAAQRFAGLPVGAVGYSYGSLFALMGGGALEPMIPGRIAGLKAVVMFSSPGPIPGLTSAPASLAKVDVPSLLITGTADVVPGFVPDPVQHQLYFDGLSAGDHTLFVVKDATHGFIAGDEPGMETVAPLAIDFLASRVLGDAEAKVRFDGAASSERVEIRRR